ncbi:M55 family metallopeptidase [Halorussus limi]|uniref:M55 family metallopeptidase n=1 Tax=Halorussus limi TaxID=2938695 RepID=A0A8U0HQB2_9EURY|nr:M55 family metallopeptidase [Halorussus limi]UPV73252.1 M55 family metallopeptidase [Halorussus limi]
MRVFISADMEGITGVAAAEDVVRGEPEYDRGKELLHGDVNAAIEGARAGGATEVLVNDSHSSMRNLDRAAVDDRATLVRGNTKPRSMMQGLDADHDCALLVGYHAKAGTPGAVLNHTFFGHELLRLRVGGEEIGELGWNARLAAALGVPVGLVTGDDATVAEARGELGDAPETVAVKEGIDRFTAACRPADETTEEIRAAARRAVERAERGEVETRGAESPTRIEADWATTNLAVRAAASPGVERAGGRTTAVEADSYPETYEAAVAMLRAGGAGGDEFYG